MHCAQTEGGTFNVDAYGFNTWSRDELSQGDHVEVIDVMEVHRWQNDASCHGMTDLFDLVDMTEGGNRHTVTRENNRRFKRARRICFECPVFQECWDDTWEGTKLPQGVIRAGAVLGNVADAQRQKAMMRSYIAYQEYQEETRHADQ